jgi:hypothetical protein
MLLRCVKGELRARRLVSTALSSLVVVAVAGERVVVIFGDPLGQEVKDVGKFDGRAGIEGDGGHGVLS